MQRILSYAGIGVLLGVCCISFAEDIVCVADDKPGQGRTHVIQGKKYCDGIGLFYARYYFFADSAPGRKDHVVRIKCHAKDSFGWPMWEITNKNLSPIRYGHGYSRQRGSFNSSSKILSWGLKDPTFKVNVTFDMHSQCVH
jgi:hypothetical protein